MLDLAVQTITRVSYPGFSSRAPPVLRSWLLSESLAFPPLELLALPPFGFLLGLKPHDGFRDRRAGPSHNFLLEKAYERTSIRSLRSSP